MADFDGLGLGVAVTAAGNGIGRALAARFAKAGARVSSTTLTPPRPRRSPTRSVQSRFPGTRLAKPSWPT